MNLPFLAILKKNFQLVPYQDLQVGSPACDLNRAPRMSFRPNDPMVVRVEGPGAWRTMCKAKI